MSKGPVIALVTVLLLVLAVVGWFQLRDRTSNQGSAAAELCVEGDATLEVAAAPDLAPQIRDLAARYTATNPVVRDHCVSVSVTASDSNAVADALVAAPDGPWNETLGPAPALWIPAGSQSINRVGANAGVVAGQPKPVASSPVVLAVPRELSQALTAAGTGWQNVTTLQAGTDSLNGLGLDGWGSLRLALPTGSGSAATGLALDAVAAATADAGVGPLDEAQAALPKVTAAIAALANGTKVLEGVPPSTTDALAALADQPDPANGSFHAVPATEQQLFAAGDKASTLVAFAPAGATPVADHPAAILATPWVDETHSRTAAQFVDFLRQPEQVQTLVDAGFRVGERTPDATDRTPTPALGQVLAPATGPAAVGLAHTFANPAVPQTTTILLDVSGSMGYSDGSGTRLSNTVAALTGRIAQLPDASDTGLWAYSRGLDGNRPYQVKVPTGPLPEANRRQQIETALAGLRPATATSTYASVIAAHDSAVKGYVPGRTNSVLLITDGPNDDTSTTRQRLTAALAATDPNRPVRVDVISIGENSDQATLQAIAEQTGGALIAMPSAQGADLEQALGKLLS
ncbi:substrate-binding domain-containing protein [Rhodococcus sp. ABRD24]|uniref:substrate-binding domain-containing protein n=1 Tax=Rhodococcus sp. ABRD24 TaxID=2507582 RepID=UPI001F615B89|nr:substrate-binding domain-containing protein [Rhodococcus sp. ABRD24]